MTGEPCYLLVLVHCALSSPKSTHFRALHASFCLQTLVRCWFHFPAGLGTCPHCQKYQYLVDPNDHGITVLDLSANSPYLNAEPHRKWMGCCQEEAETTLGWRPLRNPPGWRPLRTPPGLPPHHSHGLHIGPTPHRIDAAVIYAISAQTMYWVHIQEHTLNTNTIRTTTLRHRLSEGRTKGAVLSPPTRGQNAGGSSLSAH